MSQTVIIAFINNAALLLALSVVLNASYLLPIKYHKLQPIYSGLMTALICIAIMALSFTLRPGVIYDTRSILISVTALMLGLIPTTITVALSCIFRLSIGGAGTLSGIAVIISSALIGLAWRRWVFPKTAKRRWANVYFMSVTVHAVMLACMLLIPYPDNLTVIRAIAAPLMLIYPVASTLLSLLLMRQQKHKYIQDQLKQSEERFRSLFEKAPLGYQSLDIDGNLIEVNQQWCDLLGYSRDEVIGKWFGDFLSPANKEEFLRRFDIFKTQGHIHSEFEMLHKCGQQIFISFEGKIGYGSDGVFGQTHCIMKDITKQKLAEHELRMSEENYRRLFETMAQGVVYQAADGSVISANPAAERILCLPFDQMRGQTSMDLFREIIKEDGSILQRADHPSKIALRTGKPYGPIVLGIFQPQNNDYIWISMMSIPLFHPGAVTPYQVYTVFQDITAERKANQNYQLLFREMVDAFALHEVICDDLGKPVDYRFLIVNQAFEHMSGLKSSDILGKTVLDVLPDTETYWIDTYGKVALTGESVRFVQYTVTSDKYFEVSAYQPAPNQFACTFSDVTERVMAEATLRESKEKYSNYIENAPYGVFIMNEKGQYIEVNHAASAITGFDREQLLKMSIKDITAEKSMESAYQHFVKLKSAGSLTSEFKYIHKNGLTRWMVVDAVKLSEDRYLGFANDITEKKDAEAGLLYLSNHDFLTGLYNRRFFAAELKRIDTEDHLPLSIIMGDINRVKLINDAFGHAEGDRLIIECANIIAGCLRSTDTLARIGGDEFGILMPETDDKTAKDILDKIQAALKAFDTTTPNDKFRHSVSLGYGTKSTFEDEVEQVSNIAEAYMYQHKLLEHKSSHSAIIAAIKATMIEKNQETKAHAERLIILLRPVAIELGLSQNDQDRLELLATLHDIGKIGISDHILTKQGELSAEEWVEMKRHPEIGFRIAMSSLELISIAESILCHQEWWDGSGYPQGLRGENIPLLSRIIAVADAYDAMTHDRPYRKALSHEDAIVEIEKNTGRQFDPSIAKVFIKLLSEHTINLYSSADF